MVYILPLAKQFGEPIMDKSLLNFEWKQKSIWVEWQKSD